MTALSPIESHDVTAVAAVRYKLNETCAHPECDKPTENGHHIFARSKLKSDHWFVQIGGGSQKDNTPIPHVVGLCGSGTTGHHGNVEEHQAWIRLEDGVFVWYDRGTVYPDYSPEDVTDPAKWQKVGPLNPQPGSREGRSKRRRKASTPEERKARVNHSIRTPKDEENVLPELIQAGREAWADELGWTESVPDYYVVTAAFAKALL